MPSKVSILITNYNGEAFIADTLRSALEQTHRDLEVVVADDGSTDRSAEIIRGIAARDGRVVPLFSEKNHGISVNWNKAADRCTGEYIALLSGDDLMLPGKIERQLAFLRERPEAGICTHEMELFDSVTGRTLFYTDERWRTATGGVECLFVTNWFFGKEYRSIPSSIFARASFMKAGRFDTRFKYWNEWLQLVDSMALTGLRWVHIPERLGRYRVREGQMHTSEDAKLRSFAEMKAVIEIAAQRYPKLTRPARERMDFLYFQHLMFDWFPEEDRPMREAEFKKMAGPLKWNYYRLMKRYYTNKALYEGTGALRRGIKRFARL